MRTCDIDGCDRKHSARGYCNRHYLAITKGNTVRTSGVEKNLLYEGNNFLRRVDVTDGCWLWVGGKDMAGYGVTRMGKDHVKVHRLSYAYYIGWLDANLVIDHLCEVKSCVNPFHLEQVARGENTRRAVMNKHGTHDYCSRGHAWAGNAVYYSTTTGGKQKVCRKCNVINVATSRKKKATAIAKLKQS